MMNTKYKKMLKMLDEEIEFASKMHYETLHMYDGIERTNEQILHDLCDRGGQYSKVDEWQGHLDALCHLRHRIKNEIES